MQTARRRLLRSGYRTAGPASRGEGFLSSIRLRLLVWLLCTLALVALALGITTHRNVLHEAETLFDYQLRQTALSLRDQGELPPEQARALGNEDSDFVVQIWTEDGRAIYASRAHGELPTRVVLGFADVAVGRERWRTYSVLARGRIIQVAQPLRIRGQLAAQAALNGVLPLAVLAPVLALLAWWLVAWMFRPIRRVVRDVRLRDAESLEPLPESGLPDEVAPLVQSLNALLQRLGGAIDAQRAFVADAAHELRSPLTALRLQVDALRRADAGPDRDAALDALAGGVDRAARLVEQLLTLARSEPGASAAPFESLDLAELVRQAVVDTVPYALSRGIRFALDAETTVALAGDRPALTALVRNLADNAARYAPPASEVQLRVTPLPGGGALLVVDDAGPGIPAEEREAVFQRFRRRGGSSEPGSGLGLAIVRRVAERHHASVSLGHSPLGGLQVQVRFGAGEPGDAVPPQPPLRAGLRLG